MSIHAETSRDAEVAEGALSWREAFPSETVVEQAGALAVSVVAEVTKESDETTRIQPVELTGDWSREIEQRTWF